MHGSGEKVLGQFGFVPSEGNKNTNDGKNISEDFIYFYRGVSEPPNKTFLIEPSVFRGEDEWDLYHYILQNHSEEFINMLPIEIMPKMQHLGIPTRLLDITRNPLVAAFFAISDLNKSNSDKKKKHQKKFEDNKSTIIEFKIDQRHIKKFDSDTVKMISHFALLRDDKKEILIKKCIDEIISHAISQIIFRDCECQHFLKTPKQEEQFRNYLRNLVFGLINDEPMAYENGDNTFIKNEFKNIEIIAKKNYPANARESH